MECLRSLCIALALYSSLPVPQVDWQGRPMSLSFCFLPVVGVVIALAQAAWLWLCWACGIGALLKSAVAVVIPIAVSGGIHMDGFCDTVDALCAHQDRERSLEIMADPRAGAFAAIFATSYLLLQFGLVSEVSGLTVNFCLVFVLSRAVAVLSVTGERNARGEGLLATFQRPADRRTVRAVSWAWIVLCAAAMDVCDLYSGSGALLAAVLAWYRYHAAVRRRFGGITGDTSGFFVQLLELCMLIGMEAGQCVEIIVNILSRSF